jgi:excinuclease ABC subunit A
MDVVRHADWIVDVGPGAGTSGGSVLYSGPVEGLADVAASVTRPFLFPDPAADGTAATPREPRAWLGLRGVSRHNLQGLDADIPLGVLTAVTGVSGAGKSTLVGLLLEKDVLGAEAVSRRVQVDQRPIGRTPRSNLATYTGLFDAVRSAFAATDDARARGYDAGRFSFNVVGGRCEVCLGEGFVSVELLFLPGSYAPCPECGGSRFNAETLEVRYDGATIADVLAMTVDEAAAFFGGGESSDSGSGPAIPSVTRSLDTLRRVGLGYLRLGQPATELSGGEAQRIKLATELQRSARGHTLYVLDEPTTGLHPADVRLLMQQLHGLVDAGNTVVLVEHDMSVVASADWVVDMGPAGGDDGGRIVATGTPARVAADGTSRTAPYLAAVLRD